MYYSLTNYARTHSVLWMFLTVVLGAVFILSGVLPVQLVGTVLIAIGVITPLLLTNPTRETSTAPSRLNLSSEEGESRGLAGIASQDPEALITIRNEQLEEERVTPRELEQINRARRNELVHAFGAPLLLDDRVVTAVIEGARQREARFLQDSYLEAIWRKTVSGLDVETNAVWLQFILLRTAHEPSVLEQFHRIVQERESFA